MIQDGGKQPTDVCAEGGGTQFSPTPTTKNIVCVWLCVCVYTHTYRGCQIATHTHTHNQDPSHKNPDFVLEQLDIHIKNINKSKHRFYILHLS